jgi:hypothetical protein
VKPSEREREAGQRIKEEEKLTWRGVIGEKARERKESAERDARNQEHAASSYRTPRPSDIGMEDELSGLPWGSMNFRHVVAKGYESMSRRGSREDYGAATTTTTGTHHTPSPRLHQFPTQFPTFYQTPATNFEPRRDSSSAPGDRRLDMGSPYYHPDFLDPNQQPR